MATIEINELDETCLIADQVPNTYPQLKHHQLTLLKRCLDFEHERIPIISSQENQENYFRTQIGIIADRTASGKSVVILALVMNKKPIVPEALIKTFGFNKVVISQVERFNYVNTNMLVIPHNLRAQWSEYIDNYCKPEMLKSLIIYKSKHFEELQNNELSTYDLIVVTCTFYNRLCNIINNAKVRLRRVFYDEIDSILINSSEKVDTCFQWFVTASYKNLLYPRGEHIWDPTISRYVTKASGMRTTGFLKNLFVDLSNADKQYTKLLILKNKDSFVDKSFYLPDIISHIVVCATPITINILNGIVDRNVINCLNAGDLEGAIAHINPSQRNTECNIIDLLINKCENTLKNIETRIIFTRQLYYNNENDRTIEINKCIQKRNEVNSTIANLKSRIESTDTCCICYDNIDKKTILSCCSNAYCFKCINIWLSTSVFCPLCKTTVSKKEMYVVSSDTDMAEPESQNINSPNPKKDKMQNLEAVLNNICNISNKRKILLFSSYERTFTQITHVLENVRIKYAILKGNNNHIENTVNNYKHGDTQVLMINTHSYGSGMNLENTTDIIMLHKLDPEFEKQVIGRAQRSGRIDSLNVWYLLHDNEVPRST